MAQKKAKEIVYGDVLVDAEGGVYKVAGIYKTHDANDFYTWLIPSNDDAPVAFQVFDIEDDVTAISGDAIHE